MKKNRYLPFGYEIKNGEIAVNPAEAEAVRLIYSLRASEKTYKSIAERMESDGIEYHIGSTRWDKLMIKRILENTKYLGADGYPPIISTDIYELVSAVKAASPQCKPLTRKEPEPSDQGELNVPIYTPTQSIRRMTNEINRALEKSAIDAEEVRRRIFLCAAEKYDLLERST